MFKGKLFKFIDLCISGFYFDYIISNFFKLFGFIYIINLTLSLALLAIKLIWKCLNYFFPEIRLCANSIGLINIFYAILSLIILIFNISLIMKSCCKIRHVKFTDRHYTVQVAIFSVVPFCTGVFMSCTDPIKSFQLNNW